MGEFIQHFDLFSMDKEKYVITKPLRLIELFSGSGTTPLAAKRNGRQYLAFEIDKEYWETSIKRLQGENANGEFNLFDIDYE